MILLLLLLLPVSVSLYSIFITKKCKSFNGNVNMLVRLCRRVEKNACSSCKILLLPLYTCNLTLERLTRKVRQRVNFKNFETLQNIIEQTNLITKFSLMPVLGVKAVPFLDIFFRNFILFLNKFHHMEFLKNI